jgi:hypothetical protein
LFWKRRSIEEELSDLRGYRKWLEAELDRVRREIEEREKRRFYEM